MIQNTSPNSYRNHEVIDIPQVAAFLKRSFVRATKKAIKNNVPNKATRTVTNGVVETTTLYDYQVDYSYLIHNLMSGPEYTASHWINQLQSLIQQLELETS